MTLPPMPHVHVSPSLSALSNSRCEILFLPPTKEEVNALARVCLSVFLLARLLKNACMDLDETLRVDRCRDMDELINFWARSGLYSSPDAATGLLSRISYALQRGILLRRENLTYRYWASVAAATRGFKTVAAPEIFSCRGTTGALWFLMGHTPHWDRNSALSFPENHKLP